MFKFFQKNKGTEGGPTQSLRFTFGPKARAFTDVKINSSAGFTLVELLVSIAIIGLITAIAVFNQSDLSDQVALGNVANDIELELRSTQVYGISVREFAPATGEFGIAYGLDFKILGTGSNNKAFYTFADRTNLNNRFDTWGTCNLGGTSECVAYNTIGRNNYISRLCVIQTGGSEVCTGIARVAISFYRPDPSARIVFLDTLDNVLYPNHLGARIELTSPKGATKSVTVYTTGQISIQ